MITNDIKNKLIESTFIVRLNTGEFLIALVVLNEEYGITLQYPFILKDKMELDIFCPYSFNRIFEIIRTSCQFIKQPSKVLVDKFFISIAENHQEEFISFVEAMKEYMSSGNTSIHGNTIH